MRKAKLRSVITLNWVHSNGTEDCQIYEKKVNNNQF